MQQALEKNKSLTGRVLIVEDDYYSAEYYKCILKILNIEAVFATNGKQALQIIFNEETTISIIFTDKKLPDMSGVEIARNVRAFYGISVQPSIVLSTGDHELLPVNERKLFDYFIYKPFRFKDITECLYKIQEPPLNSK